MAVFVCVRGVAGYSYSRGGMYRGPYVGSLNCHSTVNRRESAKFCDGAMYWGTGNVYANLLRVRRRIAFTVRFDESALRLRAAFGVDWSG